MIGFIIVKVIYVVCNKKKCVRKILFVGIMSSHINLIGVEIFNLID